MPESNMPNVAAMADVFTPLALRAVATLNVADALRTGPLPIGQLADRCGAQEQQLARVLAFLSARGVFEEVEPGVYAVNPPATKLFSDDPRGLRTWLDMDGAVGRGELAAFGLLGLLRSGEPAYAAMFGRDLWSDLTGDPRLCRSFGDQMRFKSEWSSPPIVAAWDWSSVSHVVDVGGGTGRLLVEILDSNPTLVGTLLDLPEVADAARRFIADRNLSDRCTVVAGSFYDPLPQGDLYLLSDILNAVDDPEAAVLLRRCAEAAGSTGKVLIVELIDAGGVDRGFFTEMDLRVLVCSNGRMRSTAEIAALAGAAGLTISATATTPVGYTLVTCTATSDRPVELIPS